MAELSGLDLKVGGEGMKGFMTKSARHGQQAGEEAWRAGAAGKISTSIRH
jgi:hypothetical protein